MKTTAQYLKKFGTPNQTGTGYLVSMDVPFPLRIAWDTKTTVKKIKVHKDIAVPLRKVFDDLLNVYGYEKIKELGIDLFQRPEVGDKEAESKTSSQVFSATVGAAVPNDDMPF